MLIANRFCIIRSLLHSATSGIGKMNVNNRFKDKLLKNVLIYERVSNKLRL